MRKISLFAAAVAVLVLTGVGTWIGVGQDPNRRACWFGYRSIGDDDECKGSAYFALS